VMGCDSVRAGRLANNLLDERLIVGEGDAVRLP
jgi:hypothetical protein